MASRRTQPLRATPKRRTTPALRAAQRGAPAYLMTSHMKRRAAMRKRKRRARNRKKTPAASILAMRKQMTRPMPKL